ncbi:hypothetical protein HDV00_003087 [Rhizophlyctis rosea]|nr:hypothetical protein HDV00_003087 [Rhizophlyctis rosea]
MIAVGRVKGPSTQAGGDKPATSPSTSAQAAPPTSPPNPRPTAEPSNEQTNADLHDVNLESPDQPVTSPAKAAAASNAVSPVFASPPASEKSVSSRAVKTPPAHETNEAKSASTAAPLDGNANASSDGASTLGITRVSSSGSALPNRSVAALPQSEQSSIEAAASSASSKPKPLFTPRTSSLRPAPTEPAPPPVFPKPQAYPEESAGSWSDFIRSRAMMFGIGQYASSITSSHSDSEPELPRDPPVPSSIPGSNESLLSDLDPDSTKFLLARLERENQALALNRKAILVEDGSIKATQTTIQGLASESMAYSTKAPGAGQENGDVEFWNSIIEDYSSAYKIPHLLSAKVRAGIPPHLRAKIWTILSGAQKERFESLYPLLLKQDSPFERIIQRDLPRTFPKLDMFKEEGGEGQKKLYNLLKAYSIFDAEVGYCQGLSFLVGPLLMQDMTEVEAFSVFVRLMEETPPRPSSSTTTTPANPHRRYALRTLFTTQMTGLHLLLHQHTELVRLHLPALHKHFQEHGITATMYASQWFLTLFTYNFPLPLVFRIFDIIFAEGAAETMLRFSLAILKRNEAMLVAEEEFEGVLDFLKGGRLYKVYEEDPEWVLKDAGSVQELVTEKGLEEMEERFKEEQQKRATAMSESELAALQALIRQLRNEASKGQQALAALGAENAKLQKENTELREEVRGLREELRLKAKGKVAELEEVLKGSLEEVRS